MDLLPPVVRLPPPLQRRLDAAASDFLYTGIIRAEEFLHPAGEPAFTAPDSVSWQVFRNPLSLLVGGIAAVILELAEPRVRSGVWRHTTFARDPLSRLRRTGLAAMMTVYGPRSRAELMIAEVRRMHGRVAGITPDGDAYSANDPELLNWVHATASFGFLEAYAAYVCPLQEDARDRFYAEGVPASRLYGVSATPASQQQLHALFDRMRDRLQPSPIIFEFLDIMQRVPLVPGIVAPVQGWLVKAAVELLPQWARTRLGLDARWSPKPWQRQLLRYAAAASHRVMLGAGPAVQSCRRLGLPDDYLYRRHRR